MPCSTYPLDNLGRPIITAIIKPSSLYRAAAGLQDDQMIKVQALIDTGATLTCIDENLPKKLGIQSKGSVKTLGISGEHLSTQYDIDLIFPLGSTYTFTLYNYLVHDCKLQEQGIDMLIGMDIIAKGGLMFNQAHGFTFCL